VCVAQTETSKDFVCACGWREIAGFIEGVDARPVHTGSLA